MKKNLLLTLFSFFLILLILEFFLGNFWINNISYFKNKKDFETYKKYHYKLHHLKNYKYEKLRDYKYKENLIFSTLNDDFSNKSGKSILINGDSWAENILEKNLYRNEINKLFKEVAQKYKSKILNSGATSYSLSPSTLQLKIIRDDFKINPERIITIIDQTDIGDELCRYKNRIKLNVNNQILSINSEKLNLREAYNLEFAFKKQNLIYSSNFNILKFIKIKKLSNEFEKKYYNYTKKIRCKWENISDPLLNNLNDNELEYITIVFNRYLDKVFEDKDFKRLYLIFHPHKNHILKKYNFYYKSLFEKIVNQSNFKSKITIIDFNNIFKKTYKINNNYMSLDQIFVKGDAASHLTQKARFLFYKTIFENM